MFLDCREFKASLHIPSHKQGRVDYRGRNCPKTKKEDFFVLFYYFFTLTSTSKESYTVRELEEQVFQKTVLLPSQQEPTSHAIRLPSKCQGRWTC